MPDYYKRDKQTGSAAINYTFDPGKAGQFEEFSIHLNEAGGAGTLTVTKDSVTGSAYDVVIFSQDMTSQTDVIYRPERPMPLMNGDKLVVSWANANSKTYGMEIIWR